MPLMKAPRRLKLTQHHRRRIILWALAMLTWVASVFAGAKPKRRHLSQRGDVSIPCLARLVKQFIFVRAGEMMRLPHRDPPNFMKRGRDLQPRHAARSIYGSALRRALTHRDPLTRIAILIDALTHLDVWATRLTKRFRNGLRRLWAIAPERTSADALLGVPSPTPACADSS
jgi:hypothetical protein